MADSQRADRADGGGNEARGEEAPGAGTPAGASAGSGAPDAPAPAKASAPAPAPAPAASPAPRPAKPGRRAFSFLPPFVRTTTFRIALLFAASFIMFAAVLFATLYSTVVGDQASRDRASLQAEFNELNVTLTAGGTERLSAALLEKMTTPARTFAYQLARPDGSKVVGDFNRLPAPADPLALGAGPELFEFDLTGTVGAREIQVPFLGVAGRIRTPEARDAILLVALDRRPSRSLTEDVTEAILWAGALALVLSLAGGVLIGRSAAQRADQLSKTTEAVMAGDLSVRAEVTRSGDEFDRLAERLNAMLDRLQSLMQASRHAGDAIAHDLRTPLSRMRNRLEKALSGTDPEEARGALLETRGGIDGMLATFNAILRLSRIDSQQEGKMSVIGLSAIAEDLADLYEPLAEEAGLTLKTRIARGVTAFADRELVAQALNNLIDNAVKYTPKGGTVTVTCRRDGKDALLRVSDTGPGIPAAQRGSALKRFSRLDSSRSKQGSGLGLALVKAVADLHGARLELGDTEPGGKAGPGLSVSLWLPRS